jgi:hypothetical protein
MLTSRSRTSTQTERLATSATVSTSSRLPLIACGWALIYATYRGYYALGGTIGMFGTPVSTDLWRFINGVGAVVLVGAATIAALVPRSRNRPRVRALLVGFSWVAFVGCVMHAVVDEVTRGLSLAGLHSMDLAFWATIDQRAADLQDLLWNEPWFLVEGLLWLAIAWRLLRSPTGRRRFLVSGLAAIVFFTAAGLLSALGVTGRLIIG